MATHKNFVSSVGDIIGRIRENLREGRYAQTDGISGIVKELLQNAEDAKAERLLLCVSEGLEDAGHPLLREPSLLAINNGRFQPSDGRAIRRIGLNTKAGDAGSIGKFGLGLKSVFYLGEVFFFVAQDNSEIIDADIRNPWSDENGGLHPDWDEFSEADVGRVSDAVRGIAGDGQWFCIWIPLRRQDQLNNVAPIEKHFPGLHSQHLLTPDAGIPVASILPMLTSVREVQLFNHDGASVKPISRIVIDEAAGRRDQFDELIAGQASSFLGSIDCESSTNRHELTFAGVEVRAVDAGLSKLEEQSQRDDSHWPWVFAMDEQTGDETHVAEKALPHAAACIVSRLRDQQSGSLRIHWSVFLPLGTAEPPVVLTGCEFDVEIFLHGYFFVDAGRNQIEGIDGEATTASDIRDSASLRRAWNQCLLRAGTLPLLPAVLADLSREARWNIEQSRAVARAIQDSNLFLQHRAEICRDESWLCRINPDGTGDWQSTDSATPYFEIPSAPDTLDPWKLFPVLADLAAEQTLVVQGSPRLTRDRAKKWAPETVARLLKTAAPDELFDSTSSLLYFIRFLDDCAESDVWSANADILVRLGRAALPRVLRYGEERLLEVIRTFIARLPSNRCVDLSLRSSDETTLDIFEVICHEDGCVLFVPEACRPDRQSTGTLSTHDAVRMFRGLIDWSRRELSTATKDSLAVIVAQICRAAASVPELLSEAADLPLFWGTDCSRRSDRSLTWSELIAHRRQHTLFAKPPSMAYQLQDALADTSILLISKELFTTLFVTIDAPSCREQQLLEAISAEDTPALADAASRYKALDTLLRYQTGRRDPQFTDCVRYVFHGFREQLGSDLSLLTQADGKTDVWSRMARMALAQSGQAWRMINAKFAPLIRPDYRSEFHIELIEPDVVTGLAASVAPATFEGLHPSEDEYQQLLKHIDDVELCCRLPIHMDVNGEFIPVAAHTFWESSRDIPDGFETEIRILARSADEATWRRQQQLASSLDAAALIEIALEQQQPGHFWTLIMDCLAELGSVPHRCTESLRKCPWIPVGDDSFIKGEDVIHIPAVLDDVSRLAAAAPGVFFDPTKLGESFREHAAYAVVARSVFPRQDDALSMLGTLLLEDDRNLVGESDLTLEQWLAAFRGVDDEVFPNYDLLKQINERFSNSSNRTFDELRQPIDEVRLATILNALRELHESQTSVHRRKHILLAFGQYLRTVVSTGIFRERLNGYQLPNRVGGWTSADQLHCGNDGIADIALLAPEVEAALDGLFPVPSEDDRFDDGFQSPHDAEPNWKAIEKEIESTGHRLREYFDRWRDVIPNEQIGGFLALLGGDDGLCHLAEEFLKPNRTLVGTREKFGLPDWKYGDQFEDGLTMIAKQRAVVRIADEETVTARNLLGDIGQAPRNKRPTSLLIPYGPRNNPYPHQSFNGVRVRCFRINRIDTSEFSESELSELLRTSATKFIAEAYNSLEGQTTFRNAWDELAESDQLDISITRSRIIAYGFLILDQYGLRRHPALACVLNQWDTADRLRGEQENKLATAQSASRRDPDKQTSEAQAQLRRLLENDEDVQKHVLEAVQHRIRDYYQYRVDSIPFELFQNADDAYAERIQCGSVPRDENSGDVPSFTVLADAGRVAFVHYGRRINQCPTEWGADTRGFDNDLWKMSVLSLSNKGQAGQAGSAPVTGKFGLGFKSVFLVCDKPRILSGRLALEFLGGIYPRRLIGTEERGSLERICKSVANGSKQATIIELNLTAEHSPGEMLQRISSLAHILVVFSRQIRCFQRGEDGPSFQWRPKFVPLVHGCQTGKLEPIPDNEVSISPIRALEFQSEAGNLLFALTSKGLGEFSKSIPTVWVTAPTDESLDVGFVINCSRLSLDVGRARLAHHEQNRDAARELGAEFGRQLTQLFKASSSAEAWPKIRNTLGFASDTSPSELWNSLWDRLALAVSKKACGAEPAEQLLRAILWDSPESGVAGFYSRHAATPSRLPGSDRELVALSKIKYSLCGVLAKNNDAFDLVRKWPSFTSKISEGELVSDSDVIEPLRHLSRSVVDGVQPVDINKALKWEIDSGMVDPDTASRLGMLINHSFVTKRLSESELEELRKQLREIHLLGCDNRFHPCRELLIGHDTRRPNESVSDESMISVFASASRVLDESYDSTAIAFIRVCRDRPDLSPSQIAQWVRDADSQSKQVAALEFLACGNRGRDSQEKLLDQQLSGWLVNLAEHEAFKALSSHLKHDLARLLPNAVSDELLIRLLGPVAEPPSVSPKKALSDIYDWWVDERTPRLLDYEKDTYPFGRLRHLHDDDENEDQHRRDWMTLFILGLTHTMGRTVAREHRSFLRQCTANGALDMFARSERDPAAWMQFVDRFLANQVNDSKFLQWMKQFVGIYQLSQYLDDYIHCFLSADRYEHPFGLHDLTVSRGPAQQGGGADAPPLSRVLGSGACFVLRELVRLGVVSNPLAHRHCFVPVGRVRKLFSSLGLTLPEHRRKWELSKEIHRFMLESLDRERVTFAGDFDIPLQIIAEDPDLRVTFLRSAYIFDDIDEVDEWMEIEDFSEPEGDADDA